VRKKKKKRIGGESTKGLNVRANKCAACAKPIGKDDNYVFANGSKYHIGCFSCSSCLRPRLYETQECKVMCAECLPQCDGCGLSLIPSNVKHGKQEPGPSRYGSNKENTINLTSDGEKASSNGRDRGEESSNTSKVATDDMEDSDKEIVIEKDGLTQRYHRRCILKCACCRNIIQKKSDRLYKKQGNPWCARCISKCSVFEHRSFLFTKVSAVSKSSKPSTQASTPPSPTSIEELLTAEASFQSLIDFLVSDCSVENILFYLDVEAFKRLKRKQDILIQANNLFNKYLITEAELELTTIEAEERKKLTYILANKTSKVKSNFFDTAQKHIFNFLKENKFQRYLNSEYFKRANGQPAMCHSLGPL